MITSDFKQKINDISVQYYVELSWDTEKNMIEQPRRRVFPVWMAKSKYRNATCSL